MGNSTGKPRGRPRIATVAAIAMMRSLFEAELKASRADWRTLAAIFSGAMLAFECARESAAVEMMEGAADFARLMFVESRDGRVSVTKGVLDYVGAVSEKWAAR